MSDVLLIHLGQLSDAIVSTSIVKKLVADGARVHCVGDQQFCNLLAYCKNVRAEVLDTVRSSGLAKYDTAINLSPLPTCTGIIDEVRADTKLGYGKTGDALSFYNKGAELHYRHRFVGVPTTSNLFQLTFSLAGMTWRGEGYQIGYFPRNRTKKSAIGVAIRDQILRNYVCDNIKLDRSRILVVPFRHNVLKQIDEVNRCKNIVTDDAGITHLSLALRKNVEYIVRKKPSFGIEMFRSGHVHVFDSAALKEVF
jgi:hypothetical protein